MKTALMWFRRDLRLEDNTALHHALRENERVVGVFVLDDVLLRSRDIGADGVPVRLASCPGRGASTARRAADSAAGRAAGAGAFRAR
jgi:hypothetical protein